MNKLLIPIFLLSLCASSCVNQNRNYKISQIDSLLQEVQLVHEHLYEVSMDSVSIIIDEMSVVVESFKKTDPKFQTVEDFKLFDHSATIRKNLKKFQSAYSLAHKEITNSEHQLNALKHDIEYDLVSDSLFNAYFSKEKEIILNLHAEFDNKLRIFHNKLELLEIVKDDLVLMVERIKEYPQLVKNDTVL